jgi:hypothetical protein
MFTQILWWTANFAEVLLLARSIRGKFFRRYPTFYFYLCSVLFISLLRFAIFTFRHDSYPAFFWYTQYLAATVGYAVILEIYSQTFKKYRGAVRVANALLLCLLTAVILKIVVGAVSGSGWPPGETMAALERDMRALQSVLLFVIIALLAYYKVPIGRNLIGIVVGYSFYVATSVMSLGFGSLPGFGSRPAWRSVLPIAYLATLSIWCFALWSYHANPEPAPDSKFERDYKYLSEQTRRILSTARSYLKMGGEL